MNPFAHLFTQVREFLVLNGSDEPVKLIYDAEEFTIPANDDVIVADPAKPSKPHSGKNSLGEYIPGTLLVKDIIDERGCPDDITGNSRGRFWDAGLCLAHCLGLDPHTLETKSKTAAKGIMLLPNNPDPELVRQSREDCRMRWAKFRSTWAAETINFYQTKANQHRANGSHPGMPDPDYYKALKIAKEDEATMQAELGALGIGNPSTDDAENDAEFAAMARSMAEKMSKPEVAANPKLDLLDLVDGLMENPAFKKAMKTRFDLKKFGSKRTAEV